jgi:AraC-like DNA-binding protein
MLSTTHFAPFPQKLSVSAILGAPTLITVTALAGVSDFVRTAFGERTLKRASQAAMLDIEAIEDQDCFIPHMTVTTFAQTVARVSGEEHFGLIVAPHLTIRSKGCWAEYMLGAPSLGAAIERGIATIGFHSKGDVMSLAKRGGEARLGYASTAKGSDGYPHVALGTVGILLSLCRAFLPAPWCPTRIEMDIPPPRHRGAFEDTFQCPVVFEAPGLFVCLKVDQLHSGPTNNGAHRLTTIGDMARARVECGRLDSLPEIIVQQIWSQILAGNISIESTACSVGTSVRTLQRELNQAGTNFRDLANEVRTKRAIELLRETTAPITDISAALGYSAPAHFSRAFRRATGLSPQEFRWQRRSDINAQT